MKSRFTSSTTFKKEGSLSEINNVHLDGTNEKCNTSMRFAFPLSKKSEETLEEEEGGKRGARRHNEIKYIKTWYSCHIKLNVECKQFKIMILYLYMYKTRISIIIVYSCFKT